MDPERSHGSVPCGEAHSGSRAKNAFPVANAFANDGTFMEMFKKMMEEENTRKEMQQTSGDAGPADQGQPPLKKKPSLTNFVGKRRGGGVFLKTGVVAKKQKKDTDTEPGKSDGWSKYLAEVKKYKAHLCSDDIKNRPLVK